MMIKKTVNSNYFFGFNGFIIFILSLSTKVDEISE